MEEFAIFLPGQEKPIVVQGTHVDFTSQGAIVFNGDSIVCSFIGAQGWCACAALPKEK